MITMVTIKITCSFKTKGLLHLPLISPDMTNSIKEVTISDELREMFDTFIGI
jgi:hypothetical protein